jgi:perosamine synthetase
MNERIPWVEPKVGPREVELVTDALRSSWISGGPYVDRLEREFAGRNGSAHCVSTSNGTTAIHLALLVLGVGPGDEVVVPGFGFMAPANMTLAVGATPVFAEVDPETYGIDPASVAEKITPRTRAVFAVHLYGNVCDMAGLKEVTQARGVTLLEDTAESPFSTFDGKCAGTFGRLGCFSFQATKTIATGEGGAVLTDDADLADRMRLVRSHAMRPHRRYYHETVGFNFRLTNMQAALGCAQLERLDEFAAERARLYDHYRERLTDLPGVVLQKVAPEVDPVMWTLALRLDADVVGDRDEVVRRMEAAGVETRPGFYSAARLPIYDVAPMPVSDRLSREVLCLPFYCGLAPEAVDRVCDTFRSVVAAVRTARKAA